MQILKAVSSRAGLLPLAMWLLLLLIGNLVADWFVIQSPWFTGRFAWIKRLDLSETECVGTGLGQLTNVNSLILDNTPVDDAALLQLFTANKVLSRLSIRGTKATDAILPMLKQSLSLTQLEIGEGQITRAGLLAVAFAPTERLALNAKKFDASMFDQWHPSIRFLDMSDSGVSDEDIANLKNVRGLNTLSLANCSVSDTSLPKLAALGLTKLDLTGTHVTASAVAKHFTKATAVYLSPEQCQPEQLSAPNSEGSLRIGMRMSIDSGNY